MTLILNCLQATIFSLAFLSHWRNFCEATPTIPTELRGRYWATQDFKESSEAGARFDFLLGTSGVRFKDKFLQLTILAIHRPQYLFVFSSNSGNRKRTFCFRITAYNTNVMLARSVGNLVDPPTETSCTQKLKILLTEKYTLVRQNLPPALCPFAFWDTSYNVNYTLFSKLCHGTLNPASCHEPERLLLNLTDCTVNTFGDVSSPWETSGLRYVRCISSWTQGQLNYSLTYIQLRTNVRRLSCVRWNYVRSRRVEVRFLNSGYCTDDSLDMLRFEVDIGDAQGTASTFDLHDLLPRHKWVTPDLKHEVEVLGLQTPRFLLLRWHKVGSQSWSKSIRLLRPHSLNDTFADVRTEEQNETCDVSLGHMIFHRMSSLVITMTYHPEDTTSSFHQSFPTKQTFFSPELFTGENVPCPFIGVFPSATVKCGADEGRMEVWSGCSGNTSIFKVPLMEDVCNNERQLPDTELCVHTIDAAPTVVITKANSTLRCYILDFQRKIPTLQWDTKCSLLPSSNTKAILNKQEDCSSRLAATCEGDACIMPNGLAPEFRHSLVVTLSCFSIIYFYLLHNA